MSRYGIKILIAYANTPLDNLIPIGVSILSTCLKQAGHDVKLFDTTFYRLKNETGDDVRTRTFQVKKTELLKFGISYKKTNILLDFQNMVKNYNPDLIGISCCEPTLDIALDLLNSIKDIKTPKILGGMGGIFLKDKLIQENAVDIVCVGEGEGAIVDLANAIRDNLDYSHIKNLWVKKNGKIYKNKLRPLVDINSLPYPDWSIYDRKRFFKPMGGKVWITGTFEFSRGCPRMCTYCSNWGINKFYKGKFFRKKNVEKFINEIRHAKKNYSINYAYFCSENFLLSLSEDDFNKFIELYLQIRLPFWIETDPKTITEEKLSKLKLIGCEGISIGVEHGNEYFRKKILNRYFTNEMLIEKFNLIKKYNIRISSNNIIGFPEETRELIFETIELNRKLNADNIIINLFNPYMGTKLRKVAEKKGYIESNAPGSDYRTTSILNQPHLSKEDLLGLHRTFVLYVKMPKSRWNDIKRAEKYDSEGNNSFAQLTKEFLRYTKR